MNESISEFDREVSAKLPTGLNVLTILTIIGCILGYVMSAYGFVNAKKSYEESRDLIGSDKMKDAPEFVKNMVSPEMVEVQKKMLDNKMPLLIINLVSLSLCLWGAVEMRKRKKQGYMLWLIGEVLPIVGTIAFVGMLGLKGFGLVAVIFPVIFIILYTVYRKELIY